MEKIEIEDVQRLNVQPGDILLVTMPEGTTSLEAQAIKNHLETTLPIRVVVKTPQVQVEVVHEEAAE